MQKGRDAFQKLISKSMLSSSTNGVPIAGLRRHLFQAWTQVWPLLALGLVLRILFVMVGAKVYYAGRQVDIYTNGDSYSYVLSFQNLLHYGRYTFDLAEPDAAVGRLPGYPFFYGIHYLAFGPKWVLAATTCTQVLLDSLCIWLVYAITQQLSERNSWAPLLAGLLLATYPFSIVWTTITGTETLGLFLVVLWWAMLILARPTRINWLFLGLLLALIVYVREFLGICLAITFLCLIFNAWRTRAIEFQLRLAAVVLTGFFALYAWWPVRNYITLHRFIPLKPAAAGYANLREDAQEGLAWMLTWTNDVTASTQELLFTPNPVFPSHVINTPTERHLIDSLVVLSRTCASSFHVRMAPEVGKLKPDGTITDSLRYLEPQLKNTLRYHNCNAIVSKGFHRLRLSYLQRHPLRGRLEVPLQNFQKIVFKSQFKTDGSSQSMVQRLTTMLFAWRSILLILGLLGAWKFRRKIELWPATLFAGGIFCFMAIVFRSLEMRYLLQADVLLLVPAALLIGSWLPRRKLSAAAD
jgi:4-amino-4-deoxy-L-arabinose transferase-like glycosyltransferase